MLSAYFTVEQGTNIFSASEFGAKATASFSESVQCIIHSASPTLPFIIKVNRTSFFAELAERRHALQSGLTIVYSVYFYFPPPSNLNDATARATMVEIFQNISTALVDGVADQHLSAIFGIYCLESSCGVPTTIYSKPVIQGPFGLFTLAGGNSNSSDITLTPAYVALIVILTTCVGLFCVVTIFQAYFDRLFASTWNYAKSLRSSASAVEPSNAKNLSPIDVENPTNAKDLKGKDVAADDEYREYLRTKQLIRDAIEKNRQRYAEENPTIANNIDKSSIIQPPSVEISKQPPASVSNVTSVPLTLLKEGLFSDSARRLEEARKDLVQYDQRLKDSKTNKSRVKPAVNPRFIFSDVYTRVQGDGSNLASSSESGSAAAGGGATGSGLLIDAKGSLFTSGEDDTPVLSPNPASRQDLISFNDRMHGPAAVKSPVNPRFIFSDIYAARGISNAPSDVVYENNPSPRNQAS